MKNNKKILKITFYFLFSIFYFLFSNFSFISAQTPQEERQTLEKELNDLEEKIGQFDKDINKTEQEKKTLKNQISLIKNKIQKLDLQIQQSSLMIRDISFQVKDTEGSIEKTTDKIEDSKQKLASLLRLIYEEDQKSLIEVLLSEPDLSVFFNNLMNLESLNSKSQDILKNIKTFKSDLENQKEALDDEKTDLEKVNKIQILQKKESEETRKEKDQLLKLTEVQYQKIVKEKGEAEKRAREIRARIFDLIGVPKAPTFGEAYEIAKYVESITSVRPALLLAVMTQESNIGKNVGQCYLKNSSTGAGVVSYNSLAVAKVMNPKRDIPPFLNITAELGRDPFSTPVSCPMSYGWGGAMGPAQFIPSTWVLYKSEVKAISGKADPWDIRDAFLAAGLYLADYGAAKKNYNDEWRSAMIYFSGSTNSKYRFYGDSVMRIARGYEDDIEAIEKTN